MEIRSEIIALTSGGILVFSIKKKTNRILLKSICSIYTIATNYQAQSSCFKNLLFFLTLIEFISFSPFGKVHLQLKKEKPLSKTTHHDNFQSIINYQYPHGRDDGLYRGQSLRTLQD